MPGRPRPRRTKFNKNRSISPIYSPEKLQQLALRTRYTGNPEHKSNPGDFNLTPPVAPTAIQNPVRQS